MAITDGCGIKNDDVTTRGSEEMDDEDMSEGQNTRLYGNTNS